MYLTVNSQIILLPRNGPYSAAKLYRKQYEMSFWHVTYHNPWILIVLYYYLRVYDT